jgi:predicted membrane-bound mannosyltransferase
MNSHISTAIVLGAFSLLAITYTVRSLAELCNQNFDRFTYLVDGCYVMFHAFTSPEGSVVYDVYFKGAFRRTTRPRFHVVLASPCEEAFRHRLAHIIIKHHNKKVTFSCSKLVQESIIDVNGNIVSWGKPYSLNTDISALKRT